MMATHDFGSVVFFIFLVLFWPILFGILNLLMKQNPFKRMTQEEIHLANKFLEGDLSKERAYDPDDYWGYEEGEDGRAEPHERPSVRHPKNRDRAYARGA